MFDRAARGVGLGRAFEHGRSAASRRRTLRKSFHFAFDRRAASGPAVSWGRRSFVFGPRNPFNVSQAFLIATGAVALAARFHDFFGVVGGTTLGMMIANVPAILPGDRFARRVPTQLVHGIAAVMFVVLGTLALFGVGV
jgi:Uncharacterized protein family UPF0016